MKLSPEGINEGTGRDLCSPVKVGHTYWQRLQQNKRPPVCPKNIEKESHWETSNNAGDSTGLLSALLCLYSVVNASPESSSAQKSGVNDYKQQISRELLTASTQRMDPGTWGRFAACSLAMRVKLSGSPVNLCKSMFANAFTQQRKTGQLYAYDSSRSLIGRNITRNWIGKYIGRVKVPWTTQDMNKDQIRRLLKKVFWCSGTLL